MKARELELCEIQRWYPRFKAVSLRTIILPLPEYFISYLHEDGLFLPSDSEALPARQRARIYDDEDYHPWDEEEDETGEPEAPSFPDLEAEVRASIAKLDGSVFPKLNWSAPKDSSWISSNGNLRCTNFGEICLLLKASDSMVHDLSHAFDSCDDKATHRPSEFFLALRKWYDIRPEMEFRGFVRQGLLVGISQREVTGFYPALLESQESLHLSVFGFFVDSLSEVFQLDDYTFDCYITRAGKVKLVDFNPWGAFTLPLLFSWEELEATYKKFQAALTELQKSLPELNSLPLQASVEHLRSPLQNISVDEIDVDSMKDRNFMEPDSLPPQAPMEHPRSVLQKDEVGVTSIDDRSTCHCVDLKERIHRSNVSSGDAEESNMRTMGRKRANMVLRKQGFKSEFRIVKSNCHVQVNLRMAGGVPYDYVQTGPGSAWDEFLRRASEEVNQQNKDATAGDVSPPA